jgi:hypothetical protein
VWVKSGIEVEVTPNRHHPGRVSDWSSSALLPAVAVALILVLFSAVFGSADVEESANSSYSAGSDFSSNSQIDRQVGTHTILGIPVYDTLQGTGDRLPYQSSWAQSITWPLRFIVGWEHYVLVRIMLFAIPALWICNRTLRSWKPKLSIWGLMSFGLLSSCSFGLHVRQNEWSDHFVQTVGVAAVSVFFMHRKFHELDRPTNLENSTVEMLCLAVMFNGVVTGHPGFWPIALAVWLSILGSFLTSRTFRTKAWSWLKAQKLSVSVVLLSTLVSFIAVFQDLLSELKGEEYGVARLQRTAGLFSQFAFGGLYGLSDGGSIPSLIKNVIASVLGNTLMPFFILFDRLLPQFARASDFREMPRVEFTASLILVTIAIGWRHIKSPQLKSVFARIIAAELMIWMFIVGSVADVLPATLSASGAWMSSSILLMFNVLMIWLLLGNHLGQGISFKLLVLTNTSLVVFWCLFQFGFVTFSDGLRTPKVHASWFRSAETLALTDWFAEQKSSSGRVLMIQSPSFYDFLPFVAQGVPVVAPADPKMRTSGQLQRSFGFNYSINMPTFEGRDAPETERILNFLGVRSVIYGSPPSDLGGNSAVADQPELVVQMGDMLQSASTIVTSRAHFDVYTRSEFSAFVAEKSDAETFKECPVLQQYCPLLQRATPRAPLTTPRLSMCTDECLWRFATPALAPTEALILPISYDSALVVRDQRGTRLSTASAGGFLATFSDAGVPETILSITLKPDLRMLSRVSVSYINLMMMLILAGMTFPPWIAARYRGRGRDLRNSEPKLRVD